MKQKKRLKVLLLYPNMMMKHLLPPAIGILTACLKKEDCEVDLFDTTYYFTETENPDEKRKEYLQVRSYDLADYGIKVNETDVAEDFKARVKSFGPDIIGVSVVEFTMPLALTLINSLGKDRPKTIFGGIHITHLKEKALEHKEVDMICVGEGEEAFAELCVRMARSESYKDVRNLYIKDRSSVIKNRVRMLTDLERLPLPDYSLFDRKRFYSPMQGRLRVMIPIDFDRGCPYVCNFCAAPAYRNWYKKETGESYFRKKSPEKILSEMRQITRIYTPEYFYFNSDTFLTFNDSALNRLMLGIKQEVGLPFWCQTRVETVTEDKIRLLKDCGCDRLTIGIEHGNEEFRQKMVGKGFTNEQLINAMEIINKVGIPVSVNNMIGFPYETRSLIFDTIELNRKIKSDSVSVFIFYPFAGTKLHALCKEKGLLETCTGDSTLLNDSIIKNDELSRSHLNNLLKTFCLYVKFPKERWDEIRKVEMAEPGSDEIFKKLSGEYQKNYF